MYIFSLYWVFTVLTTVGYGDYAGSNTREFIFSITLEFCGLTFFLLVNFIGDNSIFDIQDFMLQMEG